MISTPLHVGAFGGRSLTAPPFDAENLTYAFGFPVPPPFVTLLNALCEGCGSAAAAYERVEDALGSHLTDHEIRDGYDLSPPELFPFAATGCDGGHFGYVIHAPELAATDYPVGRFEPSDHDTGVYLLGTTTFEAAETVLSLEMQCDQDFGRFRSPFTSEWWPEVSVRLRGLGIEPDLAKAERNFENGDGKPVTPIVIPEGWRHVPSGDGIGVLAPTALFPRRRCRPWNAVRTSARCSTLRPGTPQINSPLRRYGCCGSATGSLTARSSCTAP